MDKPRAPEIPRACRVPTRAVPCRVCVRVCRQEGGRLDVPLECSRSRVCKADPGITACCMPGLCVDVLRIRGRVDTGVTLGRVREEARILSLIASGAACLQARVEGVWRCYVCESRLRKLQWTSHLAVCDSSALLGRCLHVIEWPCIIVYEKEPGMQEQRALA